MPRKLLFRTKEHPYHVTARCNNRDVFPIDPRTMWQILADECLAAILLYDARIHAFVMMPNHLHMLISTPGFDLGTIMNMFMSSTTRRVNALTAKSGHLFGGPYHWTSIQNSRYYPHALKYVYRNPVKAGICDSVEDYEYSTFHGLLGKSRLPFPIVHTQSVIDVGLPSLEPSDWLEWLNCPIKKEFSDLLKKGFQKSILKQIINPSSRRRHEAFQNTI